MTTFLMLLGLAVALWVYCFFRAGALKKQLAEMKEAERLRRDHDGR